jgi:RNA ligase
LFGPEYTKIHTAFKRDERNVIIPGDWTLPEFRYLADKTWVWTEKVDGTNIRLHWNGSKVTVGGRTDTAQVPARLVAALGPLSDPELWRGIFPDADDVTVYGEGYGAKIQSGGMYRQDQGLIVFDVLVGRWWLEDVNVADVAGKLGLDVVPEMGTLTLEGAWEAVKAGDLESRWPGARIEGLVGRPAVSLFSRKGERIVTKLKLKDWADYQRRSGAESGA